MTEQNVINSKQTHLISFIFENSLLKNEWIKVTALAVFSGENRIFFI